MNKCLNKSSNLPILEAIVLFLKKKFISTERGKEGEREGEKHRCVGETSIGYLSHTPNGAPGLKPRYVP